VSDRLPRLARLVIRCCVRKDRRRDVEGDLLELQALRRPFWRDVLALLPLRWPSFSLVGQDLRYAVRLIRRQPRFALLVAGTLALGVASSTAIFTVCDRLLLKPLPYPEPERLVKLEGVGFSFAGGHMAVSKAVATLPVFAGVGMYHPGGLNLGESSLPVRVRAAAASAGFFRAMNVPPLMGRWIDPSEDLALSKVAILSYDTWNTPFDARSDIVGREARLNSQAFVIIGVMPRGFSFPDDTQVWITPYSDRQLSGQAFAPRVLARLAPSISVAQARGALDRLDQERLARTPGLQLRPASVIPLHDAIAARSRPTLLFLAGVVGLLLLAACANVAGLLLSRLRTRERELQVRAALGASRGRLACQLVIECLVLTFAGGAAGFALAIWGLRVAAASAPAFAPGLDLTSIDVRVFGVGLAVMTASGLLFALGPAIAASRKPAAGALREGVTATGRSRRFRGGLAGAQVATALILLSATGAALSAIVRLSRVPVGFDNDRAVVFELTLPRAHYPDGAALVSVVDQLERRLRLVPGVVRVGSSNLAPGTSAIGIANSLWPADIADPAPGTRQSALVMSATADYFRAMGIPLLAGRAFDATDTAGSPRVVIVSQTQARQLWPDGSSPIGRRVRSKQTMDTTYELTVVGVVGDVRPRSVTASVGPQLYFPMAQYPPFGAVGVVIEAAAKPEQILSAARSALRDVDPELPPYNAMLVREIRAKFLATERLTFALTAAFALVALALSAIGLYGVLSQLVAQQGRELGIRMALGADRGRLRRTVVFSGLRIAAAGVLAGAFVTAVAARLVGQVVPGLDPPAIWAVAVEALLLLAIAMLAAWVPARRASAIDPLVALRSE
jgi:putative ABC transport system permease protein